MKKKPAFTLIEMTIVLFIISLLILIVVPNISGQKKHAENIHANAMTTVLQNQIDSYLSETPNQKITIQELINKGYLTQRQADQANSEGIKIIDNKVVKS
jgi:competence protein ComGC